MIDIERKLSSLTLEISNVDTDSKRLSQMMDDIESVRVEEAN